MHLTNHQAADRECALLIKAAILWHRVNHKTNNTGKVKEADNKVHVCINNYNTTQWYSIR